LWQGYGNRYSLRCLNDVTVIPRYRSVALNVIRHWFCAFLCLAIPAFSGCGNNLRTQRQVDQFGVQRRALEDQIYDLQYEYNKLADQVEELGTENSDLRTKVNSMDATDAGPPLIDLNPAENSSAQIHPTSRSNMQPRVRSASHRVESADRVEAIILEINRLRTVGRNLDGIRGDDTLLVHLQLRSRKDELVTPRGSVVVAAYEAPSTGSQLLGRWEITVEQLAEIIRLRSSSRTIPLQLDFPAGSPAVEFIEIKVQFKPANPTTSEDLFAAYTLKIIPRSTIAPAWSPNR